ncbi:MAG TPA: transcriptional regulator BetI, partial [Salinisphaeraceae bacterium]|nr:transcriptional regulator BetI [Salinisphaeraceae bacterium]
MPKVGTQAIRRRQLIEATIHCMSEYGFERTTVVRIGRAAQVTPSIIHHYFGGKDELLAAAMRHLLEQLRRNLVARLATSRDARTRVDMIVAANFADEQFSGEVIAAWMAFWGQAQHHPALHRIYRVYAWRLRSNLR